MYEAGRESEKRQPSPLLWVVCFYYGEGKSQKDDVDDGPPPPVLKQFTDASGKPDQKAFLLALKEHQALTAKPKTERGGLRVSALHVAIARFLAQRIREAQMAESFGSMPSDIPYNQQPAWKWQLWGRYWSGASDERERMRM